MIVTVLSAVTVFVPKEVSAAMQSSSYKIDSDSLNTGGLDTSQSTSYKSQDTVGEVATGPSSGILDKIKAGYRQMINVITGSTPSASVSSGSTQTSTSGGGGGPPNNLQLSINNLRTGVATESAVISWNTTIQSKSMIVWGETPQYEKGSLSSNELTTSHSFLLTNLEKNKKYYFAVESLSETGLKSGLISQEFTTLENTVIQNPANISNLKAVAETDSTNFTWTNPSSQDFESIIIVKSKDFYPKDVKDGEVIFDGRSDQFIDKNITSDTDYYYTIFTKDVNGNYSSGVIISRSSSGQIGGSNQLANLPMSSEIDEVIQKLSLADFSVIQSGRSIVVGDKQIVVNGLIPFKISVPYEKLPEVLKTIAVTISDQTNPDLSFSFLLRANANKTAYEATVGEFGYSGTYNVAITVIDYKNHNLKKLNSSMAVLASDGLNIFSTIKDWILAMS